MKDLKERKLEFIQEFIKVQNENLVAQLEEVLKQALSNSDESTFKPMSIEKFQKRITQSMEDSKSGRLMESDILKEKIIGWS